MQKYCLVLFCTLNTESKWKWLMNVYRHYCSKSKKSEKVGMYRVSLKKGSLRDWYAQFASEFFIPRLKTVYMKNGSYRLIPFLFSLVNCISTNFLLDLRSIEHDRWLLNKVPIVMVYAPLLFWLGICMPHCHNSKAGAIIKTTVTEF